MFWSSLYHWFKMIHLIAMVAWFAGMFYIFRLFVYHVKHRDEPSVVATLITMEEKLLRIIMKPAMVVTFVFGFAMLYVKPVWFQYGWIWVKIVGVFGLVAYHFYALSIHRKMAQGQYPLTERACRFINEVPTLFLFLVVFLAVIKPF